jgi:hypothetical protein
MGREDEGIGAVERGVKLGAVDEVAGVLHGVVLVRQSEFASADLDLRVVEREGRGFKAKGVADTGVH